MKKNNKNTALINNPQIYLQSSLVTEHNTYYPLISILRDKDQWISIPNTPDYLYRIIYLFILYYSYKSKEPNSQSTINALIKMISAFKGFFTPSLSVADFPKRLTNQEIYTHTIYLFSNLKQRLISNNLVLALGQEQPLADFILLNIVNTFSNFYGSISAFLCQLGMKEYLEDSDKIKINNFIITIKRSKNRIQFKITREEQIYQTLKLTKHKISVSFGELEQKNNKQVVSFQKKQNQILMSFQDELEIQKTSRQCIRSVLNVFQSAIQQFDSPNQCQQQKKIQQSSSNPKFKQGDKVSIQDCRNIINHKLCTMFSKQSFQVLSKDYSTKKKKQQSTPNLRQKDKVLDKQKDQKHIKKQVNTKNSSPNSKKQLIRNFFRIKSLSKNSNSTNYTQLKIIIPDF